MDAGLCLCDTCHKPGSYFIFYKKAVDLFYFFCYYCLKSYCWIADSTIMNSSVMNSSVVDSHVTDIFSIGI